MESSTSCFQMGIAFSAHASTQLSYIVRQAPFTQAHLKDQDISVDFNEVTSPNDRVAIIATQPLTDDEPWTTMPAGTLWWFEEGRSVETLETRPGLQKTGLITCRKYFGSLPRPHPFEPPSWYRFLPTFPG